MTNPKQPAELRRFHCEKCLRVWGEEIDRYQSEIDRLTQRIAELEARAENLQEVHSDE